MDDVDTPAVNGGDLYERARAELENARAADDETRLRALEDLYRSLEGHLEDPGSGAR